MCSGATLLTITPTLSTLTLTLTHVFDAMKILSRVDFSLLVTHAECKRTSEMQKKRYKIEQKYLNSIKCSMLAYGRTEAHAHRERETDSNRVVLL